MTDVDGCLQTLFLLPKYVGESVCNREITNRCDCKYAHWIKYKENNLMYNGFIKELYMT